jgi:hypothetical protein
LLALMADDNSAAEVVRQAAQDFIAAAPSADPDETGAALAILGAAFALPPTDHVRRVLTSAGALVERGADATPLIEPVVEFLQRVTPLAAQFNQVCAAQVDDDADDPDMAFRQVAEQQRIGMPEAATAWSALEALYLPAIAVLAASPAARARSCALARSMGEMSEDNAGASWLSPMLRVLDREPILVLEPDTALGLVGRMSGISSNFQLHVLLMDVFPRSEPRRAPRVSQQVADIVRGNVSEQQYEAVIAGCWNLHAWTALRRDGRLSPGHDNTSTDHWIWNEGVPADIPVFDCYRVVVLGPTSYVRSFFAQRDFRGLHADIEVERLLAAAEVGAWVARFAQAGPEEE